MSAIQYSRYLKGAYPTIDVAVRIANYFKCSLDYLFGLSEDRKLNSPLVPDMSKFIDRYIECLKLNKTTHWKFAKNNNISESALRHWKYGDIPKIETLIIIAKNLFTSIDYLTGCNDIQ